MQQIMYSTHTQDRHESFGDKRNGGKLYNVPLRDVYILNCETSQCVLICKDFKDVVNLRILRWKSSPAYKHKHPHKTEVEKNFTQKRKLKKQNS